MTTTAGLSPRQLLDLYYYMRLTRTLEERLVLLKKQGFIPGGVYRSLGQEADAVGSAYALGPRDILAPMIRNLGSLLVRGGKPIEVLRQTMAKATSPSRGRELGFHFADLDRGFIGHIANLGDMVPVMAGVALAFKMQGEPRVALVYSGDGATSTGAFHEGLNFAAAQRLPLVIVVEANGYAYSTPPSRQYALVNLVDKAAAYGAAGVQADGNDVLEVHRVTREAVERARTGAGVTLIELKTYRRTGHAEHDDQRYVPAGEVERWATTNDPLDRFAAMLTRGLAVCSPADLAMVDDRALEEVEGALRECAVDPEPSGESALEGVWTVPPPRAPITTGAGGNGS